MKRIASGVFSQENAEKNIPNNGKFLSNLQKVLGLTETETMLEYVRRNHQIDDILQWKILMRPDAKKILLEYVRHGGLLCYRVEEIILRLWPKSDTAEIMLEYAKNGILPDIDFLPRLFKLPNARDIFLEFVKHNPDGLREKVQLQILKQPYAEEIILESAKRGRWLCYDAQVRIFDQPDAGKIFLEYVRYRHELCYGAQVRIFDLPEAGKIFLEYVKLGKPLCFDIQLRIFQLPNAGDIFLEYVRHGWSFNNEPLNRIFRLPGAGKIILMYVRQRKIDGVKEIISAFRERA